MRKSGIMLAVILVILLGMIYKSIWPVLNVADCGGHWCAANSNTPLMATGTVVRGFSPVGGVGVMLDNGMSGSTDGQGRYTIPVDEPGQYSLTIMVNGEMRVFPVNVQDWGTVPSIVDVGGQNGSQ